VTAGVLTGLFAVSQPTIAATISDPIGDFIASYGGPHDSDLDVTSVSAIYDPTHATFRLGATLAGAINPASNGFYVFGVDRGAGANPFAVIGVGGVTFDGVVVVTEAGTARAVVDGVTTPLTAFSLSGNTVSVDVPGSLLPSTGLTPDHYLINLWPRTGDFVGNAAISDFAPNNSDFAVSTPEPTSIALLVTGLVAAGVTRRRRGRVMDQTVVG